MKKYHTLLCALTILVVHYSHAQFPYVDIPGWGTREIEKNSVRDFQRQNLRTTAVYGTTAALATTEKQTRTRFTFNPMTSAFINYLDYSSMCNDYLNPFSKAKCTNKYNYLKNAHQKILQLVSTPLLNKMNNGVREQIMEKYTHITNTILGELEMLKYKAEKDNFYKRLILR